MKYLVIALLLLSVGCGTPREDRDGTNRSMEANEHLDEPAIARTGRPGLLYTIVGTSGSFNGSGLVMTGLSDTAIFFAERPGRNAGKISIGRFEAFWKSDEVAEALRNDPPNAVLNIAVPGGGMNVGVVEITNGAVVDSIATFSVQVLEGSIPEKFGSASLVIDAFPTAVNGQITD